MNSLSPEILVKILKFLPLNEVVKCKRVCSLWRSTIEHNLRLEELVISDRDDVYCLDWFFTKGNVNCSNLISGPNLESFNINQNIFKRLRSLLINFDSPLDLNQLLNNLKELNRLKIKRAKSFTDITADLPNLIYLDLDSIEYESRHSQIRKFNINFICESLTHLKIRSSMNVDLNLAYPSKLKQLVAFTIFDNRSIVFETIKKCSGLEYLYLNRLKREDDLDLTNHHNLKEVQVKGDQETLLSLKRKIRNRKSLKLYFFGVDSDRLSNDHLKALNANCNDKDLLIGSYYESLASKLPFVNRLNYAHLESNFGRLPFDFADKFFALKSLSIESPVKNTQLLADLLKSFQNLNSLSIDGSELDQKFFNWLPNVVKNLSSLTIRRSTLSLNFLLEFKRLEHLLVDKQLKSDLLYKLFTETKLTSVFFYKGLVEIYMGINEDGPTFCKSYMEPYEYYIDIDEMLEAYRDAENWLEDDCDHDPFAEVSENESMDADE